ncbi:ABC transporter substrate-binding protein [Paenibacillus tuaregi]|uniref:ABC transporter substrate-binding protein n=1 Tax=Paenibacillus tuaregi TaxID=1816681 RepID=UPI000837BBBC|nr:ABC transporter substrate-binding protein [Paenibacillus tuaregi]
MEIPVSPQRVIFVGETFGDLLALKVDAVGGGFIKGFIFEEQLKHIEQMTYPINLEKTLELNPDIILTANTDEKEYSQLAKIAPTVTFNTFAPLEERITLLGDLLGRQQQAKDWLAQYKAKNDAMWEQLHKSVLKNTALLAKAYNLTFKPLVGNYS